MLSGFVAMADLARVSRSTKSVGVGQQSRAELPLATSAQRRAQLLRCKAPSPPPGLLLCNQ